MNVLRHLYSRWVCNLAFRRARRRMTPQDRTGLDELLRELDRAVTTAWNRKDGPDGS